MDTIGFSVRLAEEDWDLSISGWHCPVLRLPGVQVEGIYIGGNRVDESKYDIKIELNIVRLSSQNEPTSGRLAVTVPNNLASGEEAERWKRYAVLFPFLATIISTVITAAVTLYTTAHKGDKPISIAEQVDPNHGQTIQKTSTNDHTRSAPLEPAPKPEDMASVARGIFSLPESGAGSKWTTGSCDDRATLNYVTINAGALKWQQNADTDLEVIKSVSGNKISTQTIYSRHEKGAGYAVNTKWDYTRVQDKISVSKDGILIQKQLKYCD